jgi:hypothetical protein
VTDVLGYAASCAVLASFLMRTMVSLRLVAILSNVLFLTFGYIENIHPVFFLHMALLPINVWGLFLARNPASAPGPVKPAGLRATPQTYALWLVVGLLAACASLLAYMAVANRSFI